MFRVLGDYRTGTFLHIGKPVRIWHNGALRFDGDCYETTLAGLDVHFGYSRSAFNGSWCPT